MKLHINEETGSIWLELSKLQAARLFDKTEIHTISCKSANLTRGDKIPSFEELETITPLLDVESFAIKLGEVVDLHRGLCDKSLEILNLLMPDVHKFRLREDILCAETYPMPMPTNCEKEIPCEKPLSEEAHEAYYILFQKYPPEMSENGFYIELRKLLKVRPSEVSTIFKTLSDEESCGYHEQFSKEKAFEIKNKLKESGIEIYISTNKYSGV